MSELISGASPTLGLWVLGVFILGVALAYGAVRAGWLKRRERAQLDESTRARQRSEDPQKLSRSAAPLENTEPREADKPDQGAAKPWERPGQLGQNPGWKDPSKPDLEKWKESATH